MKLTEILSKIYEARVVSDGNYPLVEPRRVSSPGGYSAFKNVSVGLYMAIDSTRRLVDQTPTLERSMSTIATIVVNSGVPVYFVQDSFARAVSATALPGDLRGSDLLWPHQGFAFGLPASFLKDYIGVETAGYVYAANMPAGTYQARDWYPSAVGMVVPYDKFGFFVHRELEGGMSAQVGAYVAADVLKEAPFKHPYVDLTGGSAEQVANNQAVTERIGSFLIKLLAILNIHPAYCTQGMLERSEKKDARGDIIRRELWGPNFIGKNFQVSRSSTPTGSHTSPVYHRRCGHITHQRTGIVDENFVSASTIPRLPDGSFDWSQVSEETRLKFWKCHARRWIAPTEVNAK